MFKWGLVVIFVVLTTIIAIGDPNQKSISEQSRQRLKQLIIALYTIEAIAICCVWYSV